MHRYPLYGNSYSFMLLWKCFICKMHVWLNRVLIISALLIVTAVNPYIIHHPVSQLARPNCAVNFTCIAIAFPPPTYSWTTPLENINDSTIFWEHEDVKPEHIGNYTCTAISNGMMARSNTVHLSGKICIQQLL